MRCFCFRKKRFCILMLLTSNYLFSLSFDPEMEEFICFLVFVQIVSLSSARLPMPKDLLPLQTRENMLKSTSEFLARNSSGLPLDPEANMGVYCCTLLFSKFFIIFEKSLS